MLDGQVYLIRKNSGFSQKFRFFLFRSVIRPSTLLLCSSGAKTLPLACASWAIPHTSRGVERVSPWRCLGKLSNFRFFFKFENSKIFQQHRHLRTSRTSTADAASLLQSLAQPLAASLSPQSLAHSLAIPETRAQGEEEALAQPQQSLLFRVLMCAMGSRMIFGFWSTLMMI